VWYSFVFRSFFRFCCIFFLLLWLPGSAAGRWESGTASFDHDAENTHPRSVAVKHSLRSRIQLQATPQERSGMAQPFAFPWPQELLPKEENGDSCSPQCLSRSLLLVLAPPGRKSSLFTPMKLRSVTLRNRVVVSPM
jgi:hypothetical protein